MKSVDQMKMWKREMEIIDKALAVGADITVTFYGSHKMKIEIKKGEPAPLTVKDWTTTNPITITPTWKAGTMELTTCETQKD